MPLGSVHGRALRGEGVRRVDVSAAGVGRAVEEVRGGDGGGRRYGLVLEGARGLVQELRWPVPAGAVPPVAAVPGHQGRRAVPVPWTLGVGSGFVQHDGAAQVRVGVDDPHEVGPVRVRDPDGPRGSGWMRAGAQVDVVDERQAGNGVVGAGAVREEPG